MAKVLVAGGAGFIGSHLIDLLLARGHSVVCVDNLVTGSLSNLAQAQKSPWFKFIEQDVCEPLNLPEELEVVFNLASPASPVDYQNLAIETLKVGSLGTFNLLELARQKQAQFILTSTSEVYGDPRVSPQSESYWGNVNPVGPRSMYDEAKRFAEALTVHYGKVHDLKVKIIRIFNTYGPRMRKEDGRVVPNFICQALSGRALTIYGKGTQTRSFCYVADLVEGIYRVMQKDLKTPINLGNPDEFTILEFAKFVAAAMGKKPKLVYKSLPIDDPKQRRPNIAKAKKDLGWKPKVKLEQGLKLTLAWFKEHIFS